MSSSTLANVARSKVSWTGGYTAPTSSAFGGSMGATIPVAPPPPAPAPAPADAAPTVQPFFRPEDLLTQSNFWAQWNGTFADLDHQLADLQTNTIFNRAQLADQHKSNVSGINDDAAARGISHSSIRDGSQAQEQTQFTRQDQNLQDTLNHYATYVAGVKNDFNTNTLPTFNAGESGQAVQNANDVNNSYVPPPAPAPAATAPAAAAPQFKAIIKKNSLGHDFLYHYYPAANGMPERWVPMNRV